MKLSTRQRDILDWLHDAGQLSTEQLAGRYQVSTQTIRRDINELGEHGLARRLHGGLALSTTQPNLSFAQRSAVQIERKRRIAAQALHCVDEGATVFLGYGTTVAEFARALPPERALRVITNNLDAALALADKPAVETWLAGGRLRAADRDLMSSATLEFMQRFRADVAVVGVGGLDAQGGLYEFQPEEAELSRCLLAQSQRRVLLADGSKLGRSAHCRVGTLADIDHFHTDSDAPAALDALCARFQLTLQRA